MLNFIKCFFFIYWDDYVIFVFSFVDMVYHVDWFVYVEASLWPWNEPRYGIWYMILGIWYGIWFFLCTVGFNLLNFAKNFFIYIHQRYWLLIFFFFFLVVSLSGFDIRVVVDSWNDFGSDPCSSMIWKCLRGISISSLYVWYFQSELLWSWPLFEGSFFVCLFCF